MSLDEPHGSSDQGRPAGFPMRDSELPRIAHPLAADASSEQRYRKLVEYSYDGIVLMNESGLIVDFNPAAERMFGYRREEVLAQPLILLMPERNRAAHLKGLARFLVSGQGQAQGKVLQLDALRKDGSEFRIELTVSSYRVGSELFFTGILRDVTERERAASVAESLARVGRLVTQTLDLPLVGQQITDRSRQKYLERLTT